MSKPKVNIGSLLNPGSSTFAQSRGLYNFKLGETNDIGKLTSKSTTLVKTTQPNSIILLVIFRLQLNSRCQENNAGLKQLIFTKHEHAFIKHNVFH